MPTTDYATAAGSFPNRTPTPARPARKASRRTGSDGCALRHTRHSANQTILGGLLQDVRCPATGAGDGKGRGEQLRVEADAMQQERGARRRTGCNPQESVLAYRLIALSARFSGRPFSARAFMLGAAGTALLYSAGLSRSGSRMTLVLRSADYPHGCASQEPGPALVPPCAAHCAAVRCSHSGGSLSSPPCGTQQRI